MDGIERRLCVVEILRADHGRRMLLLVARVDAARIVQRDLGCHLACLGLGELRTGLIQCGARVRVIESRDDLVLLDRLPFFDEQLGDPPGDLGRTVAWRRATT